MNTAHPPGSGCAAVGAFACAPTEEKVEEESAPRLERDASPWMTYGLCRRPLIFSLPDTTEGGLTEGQGISTRVGILQADPQTELMTRLQAGDKTAVAEIDQLFGGELRLFCHRMVYNEALAEDIVQDVLMTCCRACQGLQPTESLRGWLYKITRNRSIDELRKLHPKARLSALQTSRQTWMNPAIPIDSSTTPAGRAVKQDRTRRVQLAIDGMDDELREVVIMYFFQGLSRGEVSQAIGLSLSGTKARLAKATRLLREKLRSLDDSSL